ncbi:hypothetical protein [Erythrobacter sp. Alg231-14]|uniref:hypothetical protein n=1 Tax=Erythrobacter sp. Alg231-14 TaxID=1922225 RepID=UPI00307B176E
MTKIVKNDAVIVNEDEEAMGKKKDKDWVQDTRDEVSIMIKDGFDHDSTKPVLKAAAVGAVAGIVLPGVGLAAGLVAGAGLALHHHIRK